MPYRDDGRLQGAGGPSTISPSGASPEYAGCYLGSRMAEEVEVGKGGVGRRSMVQFV